MKKVLTLLFSLLLCAGLLCGCGGEKEELRRISLCEVTHSVFYAPLYAGLELGYFEEEGLQIELSNGGGADKVMTAVLAGEADIGLAGPESCIYVLREGRADPAVVFAQLTKRDGSFLMGRENVPFSWEQLRGKTILGGRKGGVPEMTLEYVMGQNGVIPHEDAVVDTSVPFNMMAGAFSGGNGDYVTLFEPAATEMEKAGKGYILCSVGEESGEIPYTAFFALRSFAAENDGVIAGFTRALARAQRWVQETEAAEIAAVIAPHFPDTDPELLSAVTARHKEIDAWNAVPAMREEALDRLQSVMENAGELPGRVEFEKLVDNRWAEAAEKALP